MPQLIQLDLNYFCTAHRSDKQYSGVCKNLHGHNYKVRVQLTAMQLDQHGFIIDFTVLKQHFNSWIQKHIDHAVIVAKHDKTLLDFLQIDNQRYHLFPEGFTTSSESIAKYLAIIFSKILKDELHAEDKAKLHSVQVWETEDASAIYQAT
ncbi:MAG: 6-carboxytetrahydropterin synthase [Gammaproteobacteria bacterium]|nr:6-carboxytetrahydropterin synthase [Gammaproteobacteria bacterium]